MKKTLLFLFLSICAVAVLFGLTITIAKSNPINNSTNDEPIYVYDIDDIESMERVYFIGKPSDEQDGEQDSIYEVLDFVEPDKTVYSMSDVYTKELEEKDGERQFIQEIDFDGTGMSMTVKNTQTGEVKQYEYSYYLFNLDGKDVKCAENLFKFYIDTEINTVLTPGEHTVYVDLLTDEGDNVIYPMKFSLVED